MIISLYNTLCNVKVDFPLCQCVSSLSFHLKEKWFFSKEFTERWMCACGYGCRKLINLYPYYQMIANAGISLLVLQPVIILLTSELTIDVSWKEQKALKVLNEK